MRLGPHLLVLAALSLPSLPGATIRQKVISIEGCQSVQTSRGYPQTSPGTVNDALAPNEYLEQMLIYLCDADLPDTATAFDTIGLEYIGGTEAAPPWAVAYLDVRSEGYGGALYSWVEEIGRCYGEATPGAAMTPEQFPPIGVCWTTPGLSWASNPQASWTQRMSVFVLVFAPASWLGISNVPSGPEWWNSSAWTYVFRLIVQYEDPSAGKSTDGGGETALRPLLR
jgi:hypothetical protein